MDKYRLEIDLPELPDAKAGDILTAKDSIHGTYLMKGNQPICSLASIIAQKHCELIK